MKRNTYNITFYCRNSKSNKQGLSPIELSIVLNGKRVFIQLPRKEYPSVFKKSVESKRNNPIREYLDEVRNQFNQIQLDMMRNGEALSAESLKSYYRTGGFKEFTIEDGFKEYLELLSKRVDVDLSYSGYKKYQNAFDCFLKFVDRTKPFTSITPAVVESFLVDCNTKYEASTVCGIMTKIKTAVQYQKDNNRIQINPFINVKYSRGTKDIEYLTEEEIERLNTLEIDNKSLSDVRDAFILQSATGLAYIDLYNLKKEDIKIDDDGTHYIVKNRHKTGTQFTTVVLPNGVEVLKKHNYNLHIITNQKYNYFLKALQKMANIETKLTTHLARKTFATMLLNRGVRLETVSKACGHSSVKITQAAYGKLLNKTVINEIKAVI
ncbi:MAG: tyrosine-type recombinase/integrase [Clostridia bacterium]|nr:tyrosine-type recombinase/integrase [Clostridia bacterium]